VRAALRAGRIVVSDPDLVWPDGTVRLQLLDQTQEEARTPVTHRVPAVAVRSDHPFVGPVLPDQVARRLRLPVQTEAVVLSTAGLSQADEERVVASIADAGLGTVDVERGYQGTPPAALLALVAAAVSIALVGTFTAVGLSAAEGRADAATLSAVGAGPGLRRRLAAAQAGVISVLGGLIGVVSGVLAGAALVSMTPWIALGLADVGRLLVAGDSWRYVALLALGPPLLTMAGAFLLTRSELPLVRRLGQ
jgi:putative ABC transport system permease protein